MVAEMMMMTTIAICSTLTHSPHLFLDGGTHFAAIYDSRKL